MKRRLERIDESIAPYMAQLETADRQAAAEADVPAAKISRLKEKIVKLNEEIARLNAINTDLQQSPDKQISLTDPDARSMATSGKDTGIVGYNVQSAVGIPGLCAQGSRLNARRQKSALPHDGNTRPCWRRSRAGSITTPTRCAFAVRRQSIRSAP